MPGPPISFLISDVDGTLVTPDKRLTEAAVAAVQSLRLAGVGFTLISSRPPRGMAAELRALEVDFGIDSWVFARGKWWLRDPHGVNTDRERRTVGFEPTVIIDFDRLLGEIDKLVGVSDDHELLARVEVEAQTRLAGLAAAVRSQPYYLDVTHREANKGHGVRAICRRLGLDRSNLAVIGDMANDVSMFTEAAFAIAMGQAPQPVRAAAHAVTGPNTEDGFAEAIRRYVLPRAAVGSIL